MFLLKKEWRDFAPGIEMVAIYYTWTPRGEKPDWSRFGESRNLRVALDTFPLYRSVGIEIPERVNGSEDYDLHHFFMFVQDGRERVLPPITEEISSQEITYVDWQGKYTLVGARWAVGEGSMSNYTLMTLDGLELETPQYSSPYVQERVESTGLQFPQIYEFVNSCALPHVFRGRIHGPRGASVLYAFNLLSLGTPNAEATSETWDNNNNQNWMATIG